MVSSSASLLALPARMNEYQGENREERLSRGIEIKLKYAPIVAYFSIYKSDRLRVRRVALLVCRYAYILRCDGVHANREYPVFNPNAMLKRRLLGDLLRLLS